jgi:hypothetical protein
MDFAKLHSGAWVGSHTRRERAAARRAARMRWGIGSQSICQSIRTACNSSLFPTHFGLPATPFFSPLISDCLQLQSFPQSLRTACNSSLFPSHFGLPATPVFSPLISDWHNRTTRTISDPVTVKCPSQLPRDRKTRTYKIVHRHFRDIHFPIGILETLMRDKPAIKRTENSSL